MHPSQTGEAAEGMEMQENNVTPLKQRCRSVILSHLSPRADIKIGKFPLHERIIKFLSISGIDDIVNAYNEADKE